jgi:hypothetical protein
VFGGLAAVMVLLAIAIAVLVRESEVRDTGGVDYWGALLLGVGVGALLAAITLGPTEGWTSAAFMVPAVVGVLGCVAWVQTATRRRNPLIDLSMLRNGGMSAGIAAGGLVAGTGTLFLIASALVAHTPGSAGLGYGFGLSASTYAFLQTFYFLGFLVGGVISVPALRITSYLNVVFVGLAVLAISAVVGVLSIHQVVVFGAVHLTVGIVIGLFFSANFNFIFSKVVPERRSSAASLYLTATTAGQSLFSVLPLSIAAVAFTAPSAEVTTEPMIRFYLVFILGVAVLSAILAALARWSGKRVRT